MVVRLIELWLVLLMLAREVFSRRRGEIALGLALLVVKTADCGTVLLQLLLLHVSPMYLLLLLALDVVVVVSNRVDVEGLRLVVERALLLGWPALAVDFLGVAASGASIERAGCIGAARETALLGVARRQGTIHEVDVRLQGVAASHLGARRHAVASKVVARTRDVAVLVLRLTPVDVLRDLHF